MSYCRWSKECDVYSYADVSGGYTTHVTNGETYNDSTLEEFRDRLLTLRSEGHQVPDYAIESIEEEIKEQSSRPTRAQGMAEEVQSHVEEKPCHKVSGLKYL
jgi:hypothetical protein